MIIYCKYCGKEIREREICSCPESIKEINDFIRRKEKQDNIKFELAKVKNKLTGYFKEHFNI